MEAVHHFFILLVLTSSAWADDPVKIETTSSSSAMGPFGCPVAPSPSSPTMNVRFHSLKTSSGVVFYRKTLSVEQYDCFNARDSQNLTATNIKDCAEATEAADLKTFSWENNVCTGYPKSIPKGYFCKKREAVVLYSVEDGVVTEPHWMMIVHSITSIVALWGPCDPDFPSSVDKFELSWIGQTIPLNGTTYEYKLKNPAFCTNNFTAVPNNLKPVTLSALDASNNPVMAPLTKIAQFGIGPPVDRYALSSGNCILYKPGACGNIELSIDTCKEYYADLFIARTAADATTYTSDMFAYMTANPQLSIDVHYVGLRQDLPNSGNWTWMSGLQQSPTAALFTLANAAETCASSSPDDYAFTLGVGCQYASSRCVCHEYRSP